MRQQTSSNILWFVAGLSVGTAAAMLIAPQSGADTRRSIGRRANEARGYVTTHGQEYLERGRELYEKGRQLADEAAAMFDEARRVMEEAEAGI